MYKFSLTLKLKILKVLQHEPNISRLFEVIGYWQVINVVTFFKFVKAKLIFKSGAPCYVMVTFGYQVFRLDDALLRVLPWYCHDCY